MMATVGETLELGLRHQRAGELLHAEHCYRQVLDEHPSHPQALHLLGATMFQAGRNQDAVDVLQRAASLDPENGVLQANLGAALLVTGQIDAAWRTLEQAKCLSPNEAGVQFNLAVVLHQLGRIEEAYAAYHRSLELKPDAPRTLCNLTMLCQELGLADEALAHVEQAVRLDPQYAGARYNRAMCWLKSGRLAEGWREYEWRWQTGQFPPRSFAQPVWNGQASANSVVLVHVDQALGDTIQFIRYLPLLRQRVPRAIVEVHPRLLRLFDSSGMTGLVAQGKPLPPFDAHIANSSLPGIFGTTLETIPCEIPYLRAKPELVARWREELSGYRGLKVGIAWQGNPAFAGDRFRSIPLAFFEPLARVAGVQLIGLQKGPGADQLTALRNRFHVVDLAEHVDGAAGPFMDTAALIQNLDVVITSDSAVAHLAGALGARVWLALPVGADWRWFAARDDSPWYPTMRLFRQRTFGDWQGVFAQMSQALSELARRK